MKVRSSRLKGFAASSSVKTGRSLNIDSLIREVYHGPTGVCQSLAREPIAAKPPMVIVYYAPAYAEKEESQGCLTQRALDPAQPL